MSDKQLASAINAALCIELKESLRRIHHCLDQLTDDSLAWRPIKSMNSISNLMIHLCGNLRQWIISGVGGALDSRDRQSEFDDRTIRTKDELRKTIDDTVSESCDVIMSVTGGELERVRAVQGREVTGVLAILHAVTHFQGHTQEIAHMTRVLVGDNYSFAFVPE